MRLFHIMKKFYRTTITALNGLIIPARLNTHTGEIKPYPYVLSLPVKVSGTINTDYTKPLFWQEIQPPNYAAIVSRETKTKQRKNKQNPNNVFLKEFETLEDAKQDIHVLDNLLHGVSHLHTGKTPTCKGLLFRLLRDIDDINAETIKAYTGYSDEYSRKLAQYVRVLSVAFDSEVENN